MAGVWALRLLIIFAGGIAVLALSMMARNLPPPWPMVVPLGLVGAGIWMWFRVERPQELRGEGAMPALRLRPHRQRQRRLPGVRT
jgi:hypothetical protein